MLSTLAVSWRTALRRMAADWLIVTAALATILLAAVLLASGPIYADAVTIGALRQTIAGSPIGDANLSVGADIPPTLHTVADDVVRAALGRALSSPGADVYSHIEAEAYELDGASGDLTELLSFQHLQGIETQATLLSGSWPAEGKGIEAAISQETATALALSAGDVVSVTNRRDSSLAATVLVSGIFAVDDPTERYWFGDRLAIEGTVETASFRTHGPFVVTEETILGSLTPGRAKVSWRAFPRHEEMTVPDVDRLRVTVAALEADVNAAMQQETDGAMGGASRFTVVTGLPSLLAGIERSLTVTRSSVVALLVQLAILAGYALILTAGLLVDTRRSETALLRSRGTSPAQILSIGVVEAAVLTIPAALAAPPLATLLLRMLNRVGPLAAIDLRIEPVTNQQAYALAAVAALLAVGALAWPAYRSAKSFPGPERRHRRRQQPRSATQRLGIDVALIGLAALAFWQLQELGPRVGARVRGQFGVDPLLILAPALGLLAGAVLALRTVPLLARVSEWAASRRSTVAALASYQVARRPTRYARSSLLLILAIGIGMFAASYSTTWVASQGEQARHAVGADVVVVPDRSATASTDDLTLVSAHEAVDGVLASMPVVTTRAQLPGSTRLAEIVALDAAKAPTVVSIRPDLSPDFAELTGLLVAGRPVLADLALPGEPVRLDLSVEAVEELPDPDELPDGFEATPVFSAQARLVLQDGTGLMHRIDMGRIPVNEGPITLGAALAAPDDGGTPSYPLGVVGIEVVSQLPFHPSDVELRLSDLTVGDAAGTAATVTLEGTGWVVGASQVVGAQARPEIRMSSAPRPGELAVELSTGAGFGITPVIFSLRPQGATLPETFPVVVTDSFAEANSLSLGDTVSLPGLRVPDADAVIAGALASFPTVDETIADAILVDLPTFQMMSYEPGLGLGDVDTYWLDLDGDHSDVVPDLLGPPIGSADATSAEELTNTLLSDPVALGTIGALTVGFVAAAVFAAVGFAVSATVSARERLVEFALLRALGLSPRQLGSWLALEQGALVLISLALGTVVGLALTATILPVIALTGDGNPASPEVIVRYPWATIVGLETVVVAVLAIIVATLALLLRRIGLGSLLRLGED